MPLCPRHIADWIRYPDVLLPRQFIEDVYRTASDFRNIALFKEEKRRVTGNSASWSEAIKFSPTPGQSPADYQNVPPAGYPGDGVHDHCTVRTTQLRDSTQNGSRRVPPCFSSQFTRWAITSGRFQKRRYSHALLALHAAVHVFDDAVMHHHNVFRNMRMRITSEGSPWVAQRV